MSTTNDHPDTTPTEEPNPDSALIEDPAALAGAEDDETAPAADESAALRKARQEAAERRVTAREATERAEALQEQLDQAQTRAQRLDDAILADAFRAERVSLEAVRSLGYSAADLLRDDLTPDQEKIRQVAAEAAAKFGQLPQSQLEIDRTAVAEAQNWPVELLHGDDPGQWEKQLHAVRVELARRFPHLSDHERNLRLGQSLTGKPAPELDQAAGQKFLAWALEHKLYDPDAPLPPRLRPAQRPGRAPASGTGDPTGGSKGMNWSDIFSG